MMDRMVYDFKNKERFILLVAPGLGLENVWKRAAIIVQKLVIPYYWPN